MTWRSHTLILALVLSSACAAPALGSTTISTRTDADGRHIIITGDERANSISFLIDTQSQPGTSTLQIHDEAAGPQNPLVVAPGADRCSKLQDTQVNCTITDSSVPPVIDTIAVSGRDGDDTLDGTMPGDFSPTLILDGGRGNDYLNLSNSFGGSASGGDGDDVLVGVGPNTFNGGAGRDVIIGSPFFDTIDAGPGADRVVAENGNDVIVSQDGEPDEIDCGSGTDAVRGDHRDSFTGCEAASATVTPDADGDGSAPPEDCDDTDPAVRPGQNEIPGNGKDDDCVGGDARPTATVRATLVSGFRVHSTFTKVTTLALKNAESGIKVTVRCQGRGCPFKSRSVKKRIRRGVSLLGLVRSARFRDAARLEVWITKTGTIGKVVRISFRRGRNPRGTSLCLPAGARRPKAC